MAASEDEAVSIVSRVPLEVWTQIITHTISGAAHVDSLFTFASSFHDNFCHKDGYYEMTRTHVLAASRVWLACRLVSRQFKAATESAFTQQFMLGGMFKAGLILEIWCPYANRFRDSELVPPPQERPNVSFKFDSLSRGDNGELRGIWKPSSEKESMEMKLWLQGDTYYQGPVTHEGRRLWRPIANRRNMNYLVLGHKFHEIRHLEGLRFDGAGEHMRLSLLLIPLFHTWSEENARFMSWMDGVPLPLLMK